MAALAPTRSLLQLDEQLLAIPEDDPCCSTSRLENPLRWADHPALQPAAGGAQQQRVRPLRKCASTPTLHSMSAASGDMGEEGMEVYVVLRSFKVRRGGRRRLWVLAGAGGRVVARCCKCRGTCSHLPPRQLQHLYTLSLRPRLAAGVCGRLLQPAAAAHEAGGARQRHLPLPRGLQNQGRQPGAGAGGSSSSHWAAERAATGLQRTAFAAGRWRLAYCHAAARRPQCACPPRGSPLPRLARKRSLTLGPAAATSTWPRAPLPSCPSRRTARCSAWCRARCAAGLGAAAGWHWLALRAACCCRRRAGAPRRAAPCRKISVPVPRLPSQVRERRLAKLPDAHLYVGRTPLTLSDIRAWNALQEQGSMVGAHGARPCCTAAPPPALLCRAQRCCGVRSWSPAHPRTLPPSVPPPVATR